eukprot:44846_1
MGTNSSNTAEEKTKPSLDDPIPPNTLPTLDNLATSSNSISVRPVNRPTLCSRSSRLSSILCQSPVLDQNSLSPLNSPTTPANVPTCTVPTLSCKKSDSCVINKKAKCYTPKRRKSSIYVHNGITGQYISSRICKIAAKFWRKHIETLSVDQQLEIGCSIFFSMRSANNQTKTILQSNLPNVANKQIENMGLKFLDMLGWLIRHLVTDNIDLHTLLVRLGIMHQSMGIKIDDFNPMLQAMHETFSYYFISAYNIQVKYSFDEIFSLAAQAMTGQDLKYNSHLLQITEQFQEKEIPFLTNLKVCLTSTVGTEYLYKFLSQTWCDEIVIFLQALCRFKNVMSDKQRFMIGKEITKTSIHQSATFCLNLSHCTRENAISNMNVLKDKFIGKQHFEIGADFFAEVEQEVLKLIMDNHWKKFCGNIKILQLKSYDNLNDTVNI